MLCLCLSEHLQHTVVVRHRRPTKQQIIVTNEDDEADHLRHFLSARVKFKNPLKLTHNYGKRLKIELYFFVQYLIVCDGPKVIAVFASVRKATMLQGSGIEFANRRAGPANDSSTATFGASGGISIYLSAAS